MVVVFILVYQWLCMLQVRGDNNNNLRGVPQELREKILAFHRVLNSPDNFTSHALPPATPPPPPPRVMSGVGLQEYSEEDEKRRREEAAKVKGELQTDLLRFSSKVSIPHSSHTNTALSPTRHNFVSFMKRKEKLRQRIQREWRRFIKWRTQKRKKKRLKRRIMRTLNKRLKKQFGKLNHSGKRTKAEIKAFKRRKRILKKRIRMRLRHKQRLQRIGLRRQLPGHGSLPEQRLRQKNLMQKQLLRKRKGRRKGKRRRKTKPGKRE